MMVITIARQIGSGGDRIADQLAATLGYDLIDRRLVEDIASITDTTHEEVERYDEKGEGRVKHFLKRLLIPEINPGGFPLASAAYFPEFGLEFPYISEQDAVPAATYLDRGSYQLLITTLVQEYGETGKAIIVGRASQIILATHPNAFHLKIVAPFEKRCQTLMESRSMDRENAEKLVDQHDRWRHLYLRNYRQAEWDDPLLYHLTINTGRMSIDAAVDLIADHVARSA
jgi:cytidylate kinase